MFRETSFAKPALEGNAQGKTNTGKNQNSCASSDLITGKVNYSEQKSKTEKMTPSLTKRARRAQTSAETSAAPGE